MKHNALRRCSTVLSVTAAAAVATVSLSSCQTTAVQPAAVQPVAAKAEAELPPAEAPVFRVGDKAVFRYKDGRERTREVTSVDGEIVDLHASDGCSWSVWNGSGRFGPGPKWSSCFGSTGTRKIKEREGNMFPLQVGNSERWKFSGKTSSGHSWSGTRHCMVEGTANITVPAGNYDTYHVVCTERRRRLEWHYSPELRRYVTARATPRGGSSSKPYYLELVSFTPGE